MSGAEKMVSNGEAWKRTTIGSSISSLGTAIAALVGFITYQEINPPRDDPFRGQEATELRRELESKLHRLDTQHSTRITILEAAQFEQLNEHSRLWQTINNLPPDDFEQRVEALEFWVIRQDSTYHPPSRGGGP